MLAFPIESARFMHKFLYMFLKRNTLSSSQVQFSYSQVVHPPVLSPREVQLSKVPIG